MTDTQNKQDLSFDEDSKFREYYKTYLMKEFSILEPIRKKYASKFFMTLFVFLGGIIGIFCLCRHVVVEKVAFLPFVMIVAGLFSILMWRFLLAPFKNFKKDTKKFVMSKIIEFFHDLTYSQNKKGIEKNILEKSDLFMGMANVYCDDAFEGSYQGTKFQLAEQRISTYVHTKNGRREVTMFNGLLLQFQFGKKFNGQTVVIDKRGKILSFFVMLLSVLVLLAFFAFDPSKLQWENIAYLVFYFGVLCYTYWHKKYKKVYLEDVVFSKYWNVKATDQIEARYILTPALMERILKIKKMFSANSISFAFFDDKVLIAIGSNKDMFETSSLFSYAINYRKAKEVIAQFYSIFEIIKDIKQSTLDKLQTK